MIIVNEDNSIYFTRGDTVAFTVNATYKKEPFTFNEGESLNFRVTEKKNTTNVMLEKGFPISETTEEVQIVLSSDETKIGEEISKPVDYWYEVEYIDKYGHVQTIIGYDESGPKILKIFPEGGN